MTTESTTAISAQPSSLLEATALRYLDPSRLALTRFGATARLTIEGEACYPNVKILRLFPLSEPNVYLSLRDREGTEIGILADPTRLDQASAALVAAELDRRYVAPLILQIFSIKEGFGIIEWRVSTTRGPCTFIIRGSRETTIVQISPNRYLVTDIEGNRFDIPDLNALDENSQAFLLRYV